MGELTPKSEVIPEEIPEFDPRNFRPITFEELLVREIKPREELISPWLTKGTLTLFHGPRGKGKTWLAWSLCLAATSGGNVFETPDGSIHWRALKPLRVLLVDGEMRQLDIRDRMNALAAGMGFRPEKGHLQIIGADILDRPIPSLAREEGQAIIDAWSEGVDLIVFDNVSSLFPGLDENDAAEWDPIQSWLLSHRRKGRSVILIHHSGKSGQQRGTSKREDVIDFVLNIKPPEDARPGDGTRFTVTFEKVRGLSWDDVKPFNVQLEVENLDRVPQKAILHAERELDPEERAQTERSQQTREIRDKIISTLKREATPLSNSQVAEATGRSPSFTKSALADLVDEKTVIREPNKGKGGGFLYKLARIMAAP